MGTNYYRKHIITEEEKAILHQMIDENRFSDVVDLILTSTEEIHLCKMSYGWKTCFDHNWGKYYQPNRKSIEEFLKEPNTCIEDEYGEIITYEKFWELVDTRDNLTRIGGEKPFTSSSYNKWLKKQGKPKEWDCREDAQKCESLFNVKCSDNDFTVDGLRFAVYSDFR